MDSDWFLPNNSNTMFPYCCGCIEKYKKDPHNEILKF